MPENPSRPATDGYSKTAGGPRPSDRPPAVRSGAGRPSGAQAAHQPDDGGRNGGAPSVAPEPRSFGADDIEGIRTGPQARRFSDYGGEKENEADRLPTGVSRTSAEGAA